MTLSRLLIVMASLTISCNTLADVINVPADYPTIQGAIDASANGDVIQIAAGMYLEFEITIADKSVTVSGATNSDGSPAVTIDGQSGGGIFILGSSGKGQTVIENLIIRNGSSIYGGGGILGNSHNTRIYNCVIIGNNSGDNNNGGNAGGGISFGYCNPEIINCVITNNASPFGGGGIWLFNSNASIIDCTISYNTAISNGGGILCNLDSHPTITNSLITNNTTEFDGGGLFFSTSNPTITDCVITGNTCTRYGAGIHARAESYPVLTGCLIEDNNSGLYGGGLACESYSYPTVTECVIKDNFASSQGGGIYSTASEYPTLSNSIVCGNSPNQINGPWTDEFGNVVVDTCPIFLGACCTGNDLICVGNVEETDCLEFGGTWLGADSFCSGSECPSGCLGDANGDGEVSVNDILIVIAQFGVTCP